MAYKKGPYFAELGDTVCARMRDGSLFQGFITKKMSYKWHNKYSINKRWQVRNVKFDPNNIEVKRIMLTECINPFFKN